MNDKLQNRAFEFGLLLLVPVIYTALEGAGIFFSGAGHGTLLFCDLPSWPFRGGAHGIWYSASILWAIVAILMLFRETLTARIFITLVLIAHYSGWLIYRREHDFYLVRKTWNSLNPLPAFWFSIYLLPQIILWAMLISAHVKSLRARPSLEQT